MRKNRKPAILPTDPPPSKIPAPKGMSGGSISFSFRHLEIGKYRAKGMSSRDFAALLGKLREYSGTTFETVCGRDHCHPIKWPETTEKNGFAGLNKQMQQVQPWQLKIQKAGRIHGAFVDTVFYVVWIDPKHALYPA